MPSFCSNIFWTCIAMVLPCGSTAFLAPSSIPASRRASFLKLTTLPSSSPPAFMEYTDIKTLPQHGQHLLSPSTSLSTELQDGVQKYMDSATGSSSFSTFVLSVEETKDEKSPDKDEKWTLEEWIPSIVSAAVSFLILLFILNQAVVLKGNDRQKVLKGNDRQKADIIFPWWLIWPFLDKKDEDKKL